MADDRQPPKHLSQAAKKWWSKLVSEFDFQSEAEWRLLEEAAGCVQRIDQCRRAVEKRGLLIATGTGSWKPNPATNIERDNRILLSRLLRELRLGEPAEIDNRLPHLSGKSKRKE
jgi:phage terminase small subunit